MKLDYGNDSRSWVAIYGTTEKKPEKDLGFDKMGSLFTQDLTQPQFMQTMGLKNSLWEGWFH